MPITVENQLGQPLLAGVIEVHGIRLSPASAELQEECRSLAAAVSAVGRNADGGSAYLSDERRSAIRRLLKGGGFSPTGRNRPAHELLLNMLLEQGAFPHINNVVDVNNLLSMEALLPISLLDADKVGATARLRWGREGESFVFNQSGHSLDVKRCLLVAGGEDQPLGTPVKDSMAGKVFDGCTRLLGVVYVSSELYSPAEVEALLERFAKLLLRETGGQLVQTLVV